MGYNSVADIIGLSS